MASRRPAVITPSIDEFLTGIRDQAGNYTLAYLTAGWMAVAAGVVILGLRRMRRDGAPVAAAA